MATVRPDDLHRAVANLVENNAVRFGAEAVIRLRVSADEFTIDIEDDGPGISVALKQNRLEPFVRGDEARNMGEAAGFGLGLSITNAIATAHGGALSLHDRQPHGLVVRMRRVFLTRTGVHFARKRFKSPRQAASASGSASS